MRTFLYLTALLTLCSCRKDPLPDVSVDIDIRNPEIAYAADSSRVVTLTVVVTQAGNYFYSDCRLKLAYAHFGEFPIGQFNAGLPTAREFVKWTVTLPKAGLHMLFVEVGDRAQATKGRYIEIP